MKSICAINKPLMLAISAAVLSMTACGDKSAETKPASTQTANAAPVTEAKKDVTPVDVVTNYSNIVHATYEDSAKLAKALQDKVNAFVANPTDAGLAEAKAAWLAAREPYGQSEVFRFYSGPIDSDDGPEGMINAWPLDEAYIDGVKGKPTAGIINNKKITLDIETLKKANERGGEANVSTGYHAIEFLLWGQDFNEAGTGARPLKDFTDAPNAERRREYLKLTAALLVEQLDGLTKEWVPNAENFRAKFEKDPESLRKIMVGMGALSRAELAGERMEVALASKDQEDEHSCFSDNTHRDIITNAQGIQNVWLGHYKRVDGSSVSGASLQALVAKANPAAAEKMTADLSKTVELTQTITGPFDQALIKPEGRQQIEAAISALKQQAASLVEAAKAVGVDKLNTEG